MTVANNIAYASLGVGMIMLIAVPYQLKYIAELAFAVTLVVASGLYLSGQVWAAVVIACIAAGAAGAVIYRIRAHKRANGDI